MINIDNLFLFLLHGRGWVFTAARCPADCKEASFVKGAHSRIHSEVDNTHACLFTHGARPRKGAMGTGMAKDGRCSVSV